MPIISADPRFQLYNDEAAYICLSLTDDNQNNQIVGEFLYEYLIRAYGIDKEEIVCKIIGIIRNNNKADICRITSDYT